MELEGRDIGRYHIIEKLGQGGMASVYRAFDTHLECDVAIKFIRRDYVSSEESEKSLRRFRLEAQKTAQLSHPNIVPVTDYGEYEGAPYLVMRYMPGGTLKQLLGRPMAWHDAVKLILPIAHALDHAHQQQMIHRDVKPANILLAPGGHPMLSDFGVAKVLDATLDGTALTSTGAAIGTPEYMAPEQWLGKPDYRTDIYALGLVFYELVTGRKPFVADTPAAVLLKQMNDPLPRPKDFVPDLPVEVEQVLFKALAKELKDRYQTMSEFATALERLMRIEFSSTPLQQVVKPVRETRDGPTTIYVERGGEEIVRAPSSRPKAMSKVLPILGALTLIVLLPLIAFTTWQWIMPLVVSLSQTTTGTPRATISATTSLSFPVISTSNAAQVKQYARWGKGVLDHVVWSSDDKTIAVASAIGILIYTPSSLQEIKFIETNYPVHDIAFSPDGKKLISANGDGVVRLWDVTSGQMIREFRGHKMVETVAFSADGKTAASSGGYEESIRLWDINSGQMLRQFGGGWIYDVAFSNDGKTLASGSSDYIVRLWDVNSGQLIREMKGHSRAVVNVAFSRDGKMLASAGEVVRLWDTSNGKMIRELKGGTTLSVAFSADGKTLAASGDGPTVKLWDVNSGQALRELTNYESWPIVSVAFSSDSRMLVVGSQDGRLRLWDVNNGQMIRESEGFTMNAISSIASDRDGKILASGGIDGVLRFWDVSSGQVLRESRRYPHLVGDVAFSPDGKILAVGTSDDIVRLWNVSSGQVLRELKGHTDNIQSVAFSPDGKTLASGGYDSTVRLWKVSDGLAINSLLGHAEAVWGVAFSPDGKTLASASVDKSVRIWDVNSGQSLREFKGHTSSISSVAFSPDGKTLASGSYDKTVRLWDVSNGQLLREFKEHLSSVTSVVFSPDGRLLVSGSVEPTVRLWNVSSGQLLRELKGHTNIVRSIAFRSDGQMIISASSDGTIRLWAVQP